MHNPPEADYDPKRTIVSVVSLYHTVSLKKTARWTSRALASTKILRQLSWQELTVRIWREPWTSEPWTLERLRFTLKPHWT